MMKSGLQTHERDDKLISQDLSKFTQELNRKKVFIIHIK